MSKLNAKQHIEINLDMDELDLTDAEKKATYQEIKDLCVGAQRLESQQLVYRTGKTESAVSLSVRTTISRSLRTLNSRNARQIKKKQSRRH